MIISKDCPACEGRHFYTAPADIGIKESLESLSRFLDFYLCKKATLGEVEQIRSFQDTLHILATQYPDSKNEVPI